MPRLAPAERLLQHLGISEPNEIDLEAIAFHLGAKVRYRPLEGCEARIIGRDDEAIITIAHDRSKRRKRFSLAHEIGHWTHDKGRTLVCRVEESRPQDRLSPERIANNFAADLLMPHYMFGPIARSYARLNFKTINEIADIFDTSLSAAAIRFVEGGYQPALLVCHCLKGRKWFARGPDVPPRWFPRDDLDADSFGFGVLFGKRPDDHMPRKIDADAWFDRRDAGKFTVHEQTVRVSSEEILTLVLLSDPEMLEDRG